jgi:hypothetical protein
MFYFITATEICKLLFSQTLFSFGGECPPGTRSAPLHKIDRRHEHIDDTGIVHLPRYPAQRIVQGKWIFADQFCGMIDADGLEILCRGFSDVRKIDQPGYGFPVWVFHMRPKIVVCPLTSKLHPKWRTRLQIECAGKNAEIAVDQIRIISKQQLKKKIDHLSENKAAQLRKLITDMYGE